MVLVGFGFGVDFWLAGRRVEADDREVDGVCAVLAPDWAADLIAAGVVAADVGSEAADAVAPGDGAAAAATPEIGAADDARRRAATRRPATTTPSRQSRQRRRLPPRRRVTMTAAIVRWTLAM